MFIKSENSFRWVSPSKANVFRSFEVMLNYLLQVVVEHTMFHFGCAVGIGLLTVSVVCISFETKIMQKYRGKYWCI